MALNCVVRCFFAPPPPFGHNHTRKLWNHNSGDEKPQFEHMIGRGNLSVKSLEQSDAAAPAEVDTEEAKKMKLTVSLEPGDKWKWMENITGVTVTMLLAYTPPRCKLLAVNPATALV